MQSQQVEVRTSGGASSHAYIFEPERCPICKRSIKAHFLYAYLDENTLFAFFECKGCHRAFVKMINNLSTKKNGYFCEDHLANSFLAPNPASLVTFSKYINEVSPSFVKIYNEANTAECANLSEIAGMGYRKAIEFLIKDYLISKSEESECDKIKKEQLGTCIKNRIENPQLKIVAERAVWIGNDETHYIRKHEDKDIDDLKRLIEVTVRWVEMELMTKEASGILPR